MHFDYRMLKQVAGGLGIGRRSDRGRSGSDTDADEMSPPEDWSDLVRREIRDQPPEAGLQARTEAPRPVQPRRPARPPRPAEAWEDETPEEPTLDALAGLARAPDPERTAPAASGRRAVPARPASLDRGVYEFTFDPLGRELPPTERLDDPAEALSIELEPGTPGHLHLVRGRASDIHAESAWVDVYLSARHDLPESAFDEESGLYRSDAAARVLRVELGSLRRQARPGAAPGRINESPDLRFDRPVASSADWTP